MFMAGFVLVLLIASLGAVLIAPANALSQPLYWASFVAWGIIAKLSAPIADSLPGRRKSKSPLIRGRMLAFILIAAAALSYIFPATLTFLAGFAGFPAGLAVSIGVYLSRVRQRFCPSCGRPTWFLVKEGELLCTRCGHRWSEKAGGASSK